MTEQIIERLKANGWSVDNKTEEILVYRNIGGTNMKNPCETFLADKKGFWYWNERMQQIQFCDFGRLDLNCLAMYCYCSSGVYVWQKKIREERKNIESKENDSELIKSVVDLVGEKEFYEKVNLDFDVVKNDAFNVSKNEDYLRLTYNIGDYETCFGWFKNRNVLFARLFESLIYKKAYEKEILKSFGKYLSTKQKLTLLMVFAYKTYDKPQKRKGDTPYERI